jgi:hypothetical protein
MALIAFLAFDISPDVQAMWNPRVDLGPDRVLVFRNRRHWIARLKYLVEKYGFPLRTIAIFNEVNDALDEIDRLRLQYRDERSTDSPKIEDILRNADTIIIDLSKKLTRMSGGLRQRGFRSQPNNIFIHSILEALQNRLDWILLQSSVSRPAYMAVGYPAGGGTESLAKGLAVHLRGGFASAVLIENQTGGAGMRAVEYVKSAEASGRVMLLTPDFVITLFPHSIRPQNYNPLRDLAAVSPITQAVLTVSIGPLVPDSVRTFNDYLIWCNQNPEEAKIGTTGAGTTSHFVGAM